MLSNRKIIILAALLSAVGAILVAYWQFINIPSNINESVELIGRVRDADTGQAIAAAKVNVDTGGVPQIYYTDSNGLFSLKLNKITEPIRIRVEATGYEVFNHHISPSEVGIEDVRLTRITRTTATPSPQTEPIIKITHIPPYDPTGGESTRNEIAGEVSGVEAESFRVVIYTRTDRWYVQPFADAPLTGIQQNGEWQTEIHTGTSYAVLLVKPGFDPAISTSTLPHVGGAVVAITVVPGKR
jgi:hypothetical protein